MTFIHPPHTQHSFSHETRCCMCSLGCVFVLKHEERIKQLQRQSHIAINKNLTELKQPSTCKHTQEIQKSLGRNPPSFLTFSLTGALRNRVSLSCHQSGKAYDFKIKPSMSAVLNNLPGSEREREQILLKEKKERKKERQRNQLKRMSTWSLQYIQSMNDRNNTNRKSIELRQETNIAANFCTNTTFPLPTLTSLPWHLRRHFSSNQVQT